MRLWAHPAPVLGPEGAGAPGWPRRLELAWEVTSDI